MTPETQRVAVIGMGYVGLTLASVLAREGFRVHGVENNPNVVTKLNNKDLHLVEPGVEDAIANHIGVNWTVSDDYPFTPDVAILCVSTPVGTRGEPDLENLKDATKALARVVDRATLVIVRSTVPVGTTRELVAPLLEEHGQRPALAFCPERTIQGIALREIQELPQVIGGRDPDSLHRCETFFSSFVRKISPVSSLEAAELVKLVNNCHTDLIYSYGNVVALMALERKLDPLEVIEAANTDYPRPNLARPGFVGGACLTKDPYILAHAFEGTPGQPEMVRRVRELNESMPHQVAQHFNSLMRRAAKVPTDANILVCGYAYKGVPETDDMRGAPVTPFLEDLMEEWPNVVGHDYVVRSEVIEAFGTPAVSLEEGFREADGVIFLNDHPRYRSADLEALIQTARSPLVVFDSWRLFRDRAFTRSAETIYAGIGYEA